MLSEEKNRMLTQVGPGTPMGDLLRRYWMPIAGVSELDDTPTKPVRLMGEDLVLYKDLSGTFGLVDRHCPHRRADLAYGMVEDCGLRCNYHGWALRPDRRSASSSPSRTPRIPSATRKARVAIKAYPVQAKGGMLWAYMGPQPAPLLPDWEAFSWDNGFAQIVISEVPCNWLQCQENSIDPVHFEWMHENWGKRLRTGDDGATRPTHLKLDFDEFEYGFVYRRVREDSDENDDAWTIGRVCLWPNGFFLGEHFEWRVPIDDENTLSVTWKFTRVPGREPYVQTSIPTWHGPLTDENGHWITTHVMNQDFLAWVGQGRIADRTQEHLGAATAASSRSAAASSRNWKGRRRRRAEGHHPRPGPPLFWLFGHPEVYILILPGHGHRLRDPPGVLAQAAVRPLGRDLLRYRDRVPRLGRVGAPHVRHRPRAGRHHRVRALDDAHRDPDRREDLQLDRHRVGRLDPTQHARCCSRSASSRCSPSAVCRASRTRSSPPTRSRPTPTTWWRTSTTCCSAVSSSRSSAASTTGGRRSSAACSTTSIGKVNFWLMLIGFNLTFFPMHVLGLQGQPRRTYRYASGMGWDLGNQLATIGAFVIALSVLVFLVNVVKTAKRGEVASADPWDGRTLEWSIPSPAPEYNFAEIPEVHAADDFWHRKYTEDEEGRLVRLPAGGSDDGAVAGGRRARQRPRHPPAVAVVLPVDPRPGSARSSATRPSSRTRGSRSPA